MGRATSRDPDAGDGRDAPDGFPDPVSAEIRLAVINRIDHVVIVASSLGGRERKPEDQPTFERISLRTVRSRLNHRPDCMATCDRRVSATQADETSGVAQTAQ